MMKDIYYVIEGRHKGEFISGEMIVGKSVWTVRPQGDFLENATSLFIVDPKDRNAVREGGETTGTYVSVSFLRKATEEEIATLRKDIIDSYEKCNGQTLKEARHEITCRHDFFKTLFEVDLPYPEIDEWE